MPEFTVERLSYGTDSEQYGILHVPKHVQSESPIALLHGGWWKSKTTIEQTALLAEELATRGFLVINLEFRRVGNGGGWPITFLDVCVGIDLLGDIASKYSINSRQTIVIGFSSGGHLALLAGTRSSVECNGGLALNSEVKIKLVVSLAGIANVQLANKLDLGPSAVRNFVSGDVSTDVQMRNADPMSYVQANPKVILAHGERDEHVPISISKSYAENNPASELVTCSNADHFTLLDPTTAEWKTVAGRIMQK